MLVLVGQDDLLIPVAGQNLIPGGLRSGKAHGTVEESAGGRRTVWHEGATDLVFA